MEDILKDILEICTKAWYVMVANPVMAGITYLKRTYPQVNLVGMCHGYCGVYSLERTPELEREHISP